LTAALDQADSLSLCQKAGDDARLVHTLVSRTVRRRRDWPEPARAEALRQAAVRVLIRLLVAMVDDPAGRRQVAREVAHAQHLVSGGLANAELATLGMWLARYHYESGDFRSARALQEQVLKAHRRLLGPEHPDTLKAMNNLAQTLKAQGDLGAARALQEQVLEARRRLLGPEHPDTLTAMGNLASTLWEQGELGAARALEEQVLEAFRRLLDPEHPATLTAMNNLAQTLKAQGELGAARALEEQVLEARRRLLGPEHPDTTIAAWNYWLTLRKAGEHAAAARLFEESLRWLVERDPSTLSAGQRKIREDVLRFLGGD
jgi:uncharacterized protein (DUF2267 family)